MSFRRWIGQAVIAAIAGLGLFLVPQSAQAGWLRAESDHFIVYSDGREPALTDYVQKLEMFDRVMRSLSGITVNTAPPRKLPIYLVGARAGMLQVNPQSPEDVLGTYFPTDEDIFAVAVRQDQSGMSGADVLRHEYCHHFMLGNFPGSYPSWYVEGFAEYYMTAEVDVPHQRVIVGGLSENRAYGLLTERWIPLDVLLRKTPNEVERGSQRDTYYPIAWLLTHWFFSDPVRREKLNTYLSDVAAGGDPVEAMERATGMTLTELEATLRLYSRSSLTGSVVTGRFPQMQIAVTRLSHAADELLLINQRLKIGVPDQDREALGREVARRAARYGDDPLALMAAGHAGLHFGNRPAGERALQRLLEIDPNHIEALQYLAQERLRQASQIKDATEASALRSQARAYLARAYAAGQNDYRTLMLLSALRHVAPNFPNENDLLTLELAMERAPQLASVRFQFAMALAHTGNRDRAVTVLRPLANDPHGGTASAYADRMIAALEAGQPLPDMTQETTESSGSEAPPTQPEVPQP